MEISYKLDNEGGLDALELLGSLTLCDDSKKLSFDEIYVDSFFHLFLDAIDELRYVDFVEIDVPEESMPIKFAKEKNSFLTISTENHKLESILMDEFIRQLGVSCSSFLKECKSTKNYEKNSILPIIYSKLTRLNN